MKKLMVYFFAFIMMFSMTVSVQAINCLDDLTDSDIVVDIVEDFLTACLNNSYLYTDVPFDELTILSISEEETGETIDYAGKTVTLSDLEKNINFIKAKNTYWQYVRKAQNIYRTDFNINYHVQNIEITKSYATVTISAMMSFKYIDSTEVSYKEDLFIVNLLKAKDRWFVVDAYEPFDWFDSRYKYSSDFKLDSLLSEYAEEDTLLPDVGVSSDNNVTRSSSLSYNADNATAYAYTYTTSVSENTPTDFYNDNFQYFSSDCMNFASQCVWAGFGGNNDVDVINSNVVPMDSTGSYYWFNSKTANQHSGSWSSCSNFRTYATNSNGATSETGLRTTKYSIGSNNSFYGYTSFLYGSILHVPGASGSYGHAVFVTDVDGSSRSSVYYCAHTTMAKHVKIGEDWPTGEIYIYQPTSFYSSATMQSPVVSVEMVRPIAIGTALTLTAGTDVSGYSIQTRVTTPSGSTSTSTSYNTTSATKTYTFNSVGLYTIRVAVKQTSSSTAYYYYYTVRVY